MQLLPVIYFVYMFVAIYLLVLNMIVYFRNKHTLFSHPKLTKAYSLSVLVPAFNEQNTIENTIKHIFETDYPNLVEVLVINDGSIDGTLGILKKLLSKYSGHKTKLKILNKNNSGKADSLNRAIKFAQGELVAVIDADSYPAVDSFSKLAGYFDEQQVGAATAICTPKNRSTLLEKMQTIEYKVIAFTRKLFEYVESIYVTPGSLTIYRKKALEDIGGFDTKNVTEDIEATFHLIHNKWKIRMAMPAVVHTTVPNKIGPWFGQRRRWSVGGIQVLNKYKKSLMKDGMLGYFIVPFFATGLVLGLVGIGFFAYILSRRALRYFLLTQYSIELGVPVLTMNELLITPSVLNYFGIVLLGLFFMFTVFVLAIMKDNVLERQNIFNLLFYLFIYLLIYPIVLIVAIGHMMRGKRSW